MRPPCALVSAPCRRYTSAIITLIAQDPGYLQLVDELLSGAHHNEQQRGPPPQPASPHFSSMSGSMQFGSFAPEVAASGGRRNAAGVYICALEKLGITPSAAGSSAGPDATAVPTAAGAVPEEPLTSGQPRAGGGPLKLAASQFIAFSEIAEAARERGWTALGLLKASSISICGGSSGSRPVAGAAAGGGRLILAPPAGQLLHVQEGDMIAVLAHGEP